MISNIFDSVMKADENIEFLVKASYIEIYMEKIRDLLDCMLSFFFGHEMFFADLRISFFSNF